MAFSITLLLRILLAACLFGFLVYAFYSLWKELRHPFSSNSAPGDLSVRLILGIQQAAGENSAPASPESNAGSSGAPGAAPPPSEPYSGPRLVFRADTWWLEGPESNQSMLLNGAPLTGPTKLQDWDEVRVNPPAPAPSNES